jgi:hypothetical protein
VSLSGRLAARYEGNRRYLTDIYQRRQAWMLEPFRHRGQPWVLEPVRNAKAELNWAGEYAGKWLDAACLVAAGGQDPQLEQQALAFAPTLAATQEADGYLGIEMPPQRGVAGRPVGFIANQPLRLGGMINSNACDKGAHFIALCDAFGLPLVSFIDVPGFSIGSGAERTSLGRRSAKLIFEWGHASVPRVSVVLRKGYGLGYFAMAGGRSFAADAALAWPSAEICAMSIEGAIDVAFRKEYLSAADPMKRRQEMIDETRSKTGALRGAEGFGVDDIIDPRDTRRRLAEIFASTLPRRPVDHPLKYRSIAPI